MGHEAHNDHRLFALRGIWRYAGKRHPFVMQAGDALSAGFVDVRGYLAFYANRITSFGDGERVRGQAGRFNRDGVTKALVGLCTGDPSTRAW